MNSTTIDTSDLPVQAYRDQILRAVDRSQVTIITAETGAGKSTQVPQFLADHGYSKIIITQPRILAARNLSLRVRQEWQQSHSDQADAVGYRTASERNDTAHTKILYCTDGLQLVREITGVGVGQNQVLVLDEVHEWNENMEVLVAWARDQAEHRPDFKVVLMSATIETDQLAAYFGAPSVLSIPGRSFPVKKTRGTDVVSEILQQLGRDRNMLVFLPGKSEIQDVSDVIQKRAQEYGVPVLPLHGQLTAEQQQRVFQNYPWGKVILSTNIAQTSVTIDDIDLVIDSGLERRADVRNGVEGLFLAQISQADCLQRAGRAGRTKPGEYVLAPYNMMPCLPLEERDAYPIPEILRKPVDRLTLRLLSIGIDIEKLRFYHELSKRAIIRAKHKLIALGAITKQGDITKIGRYMEQFPVSSSYARMLTEARTYEKPVQVQLAVIIAIQEEGGIVKSGSQYVGWRRLTKQTHSDLLAQYDVYLALDSLDPDSFEEIGIIEKNVYKAREIVERLLHSLGLTDVEKMPITPKQQTLLMKAIVAGQVDQLWSVREHGEVVHLSTKKHRELSSNSVVKNPKLVVGEPFDLQIASHSGGLEVLHLVQSVTSVNTNWLATLAPQLFRAKYGQLLYDPHSGCLAKHQFVRFGHQLFEGASVPVQESTPSNQRAFNRAFAEWAHGQLEKERLQLGRFHTKRIPAVSLQTVEKMVQIHASGVISLDELSSQQKKSMLDLSRLVTYLGESFMHQVLASHRATVHHKNYRRHGWRPAHKRH